MPQARLYVNDTHDRIHNGHPWVFDNQVVKEEGAYAPGDIVQVFDAKRRPLGQGYINPASMIRVRMLTPHKEERVSSAFLRARIQQAWDRRKRLGYAGSCRVVFSEADLLPGLVVDLFHDVQRDQRFLSVQFLTLGMERWREVVLEALQALEARQAEAQAATAASVLTKERPTWDPDPNAPFPANPAGDATIVEFFDYNCPYCKRAMPEVNALMAEDTNVRLVLREWPILSEGSAFAARAALASRRDRSTRTARG